MHLAAAWMHLAVIHHYILYYINIQILFYYYMKFGLLYNPNLRIKFRIYVVGYNRSLLKSTQHTSNTMVDVLHDPSFLVAVGTLLQFAVSSDEIQQHIVLDVTLFWFLCRMCVEFRQHKIVAYRSKGSGNGHCQTIKRPNQEAQQKAVHKVIAEEGWVDFES